MKKFLYLICLSVFTLAWNGCGGGGDDNGDPNPGEEETPDVPETVVPSVGWVLKSGIIGMDDAALKTALNHLRVYLYDKEEKLLSSQAATTVDGLKKTELEAGTYTAIFIGNVSDDANISGGDKGTSLADMSVVLNKPAGAANYAPLGDVMYGKVTFTVGESNMEAEITVKRTQSVTRLELTDYSGIVQEAGVLIPGVGTRMGFKDAEWVEPGTVFVNMGDKAKSRSITRAGESERTYSVAVNIAVVVPEGSVESPKVQCNIIAKDESGKVVMAQAMDIPAEVKPNTEMSVNLTVKEEVEGDGELTMEIDKAEIKDESGKTEDVPVEDIPVVDNSVNIDVRPGDWESGNTEEIEIGNDKGYIRPGGSEDDWEAGGSEDVVIGKH